MKTILLLSFTTGVIAAFTATFALADTGTNSVPPAGYTNVVYKIPFSNQLATNTMPITKTK